MTEERVEYLPFQDPTVGKRYPELPPTRFETAVHLVETDGSVYSGAEAVFRSLNYSEHGSLLLDWYRQWPGFARLTEVCYAFVANHRQFFSIITRGAWGQHLEPAKYLLVRNLFIKSLGLIYLVAFLSLWAQVPGLIGSNGILPANLTMFGARQEANASQIGWKRYQQFPTLCWLSATDKSLNFQCAAGTILSILVISGIAPAPCLFLLWLIYLSLCSVSREFLGYQWDSLLLETGFLAIFFAPLQWLPRWGKEPPPSKLVLWLLRWLLFRLMLGSGLVKLLSGDPTWRNLTALKYHYETQPLPTWVGWYMHQLPGRVQQLSALFLFVIELGFPFLIFAPRRLRLIPFTGFILLQILILVTGNYCFFNLLTILLCLILLDDFALEKRVPEKCWKLINWCSDRINPQSREPAVETARTGAMQARKWSWPIYITVPLACIWVLIPLIQFAGSLRARVTWPGPLRAIHALVDPFRSLNHYGLFSVMTTNRFEIVVQGSNDGVHWLDYEFYYKPGDLKRRPGFVEPHQPRLDWQMWFAALGDYRQNFWFIEFCVRLLNGSPEVLGLIRQNPFPARPPKYIRAVLYEYHFTDKATRRRTGAWWWRERKGDYLPVISRGVESK